MRCPYCGGFNQDNVPFCRSCGRDLNGPPSRIPANKQPVSQPPRPARPVSPPPQRPAYPAPKSPYPVTPVQAPPAPKNVPGSYTTRRQTVSTPSAPPTPVAPTEPEPPAPFPPRTVEQLRALEQGALNYTLVSDDENVGRKRIVRVAYPPCAGWQQLATLYKVLHECKEDRTKKFDTVIVQGVTDANVDLYNFNNGQLIFDRGVRLGSEILNRYQLETGNGFAGDAMRLVLTEVVN
jgi:hypothetical protein